MYNDYIKEDEVDGGFNIYNLISFNEILEDYK